MIIGVGLDVARVSRVARLLSDHTSELGRIFTPNERAFCEAGPARRRHARYAGAFAGKEAVMKALATGWRSDIEWSDIDTRPADARGGVALRRAIREVARRQGVDRIDVTVAAAPDCAMATALAQRIDGVWKQAVEVW